ncbi:hypothetical protein MHBO_004886 [Bonamia ostreae]|uniref:Uncharacterized protein n=1 Tax=Bonamia ostreae TaxID=126728 RepID=A0ABV2AUI6_9EUKA
MTPSISIFAIRTDPNDVDVSEERGSLFQNSCSNLLNRMYTSSSGGSNRGFSVYNENPFSVILESAPLPILKYHLRFYTFCIISRTTTVLAAACLHGNTVNT